MIIGPEAPSPYSSEIPELQLAWDSTSLREFQACPRKYYYRQILGWVTKASRIHLEFGIRYHAALEKADHLRFAGKSLDEQMCAAADMILDDPWDSDMKEKDKFTLLRSVIWYLEHWKDRQYEIAEIGGEPAIELSFRFPIDLTEGDTREEFLLCGHLDGAFWNDDELHTRERKSTKYGLDQRYWESWTPGTQITLYSIASKIIFPQPAREVMVDACQTAVNFSRFARQFIPRTRDQLSEAMCEFKEWIKQAAGFAKAGFWPKNEGNCFLCEFRPVCSRDPAVRSSVLESKFVKHKWNPLEIRE